MFTGNVNIGNGLSNFNNVTAAGTIIGVLGDNSNRNTIHATTIDANGLSTLSDISAQTGTQAFSNVDIDGGLIDGVTIGADGANRGTIGATTIEAI